MRIRYKTKDGMFLKFVGQYNLVTDKNKAAPTLTESGDLQLDATLVSYNTVDEYGDIFLPGSFSLGANDRATMLGMHMRANVIGSWANFSDSQSTLKASGLVWKEAAIAQRAIAERVWTDVSVGIRIDEFSLERRDSGMLGYNIAKATLIEASIVDNGAVPGAEIELLVDEPTLEKEEPVPSSVLDGIDLGEFQLALHNCNLVS